MTHEERRNNTDETADSAFEALWTANRGLMREYCTRYASHRADEAFSKATFVAFSKFAQCRTVSAAWLMRVTQNVSIDLRREDARVEPLGDDDGSASAEWSPAAPADPERALLAREETTLLFHCLADLPARLREPLLLHAMLDFDHARIAETLSITNACARKRISQARAELRRCMHDERVVRRARAAAATDEDWWHKGQTLAAEVARRAARTSALPPAEETSVVTFRRNDGSERDITLYHTVPAGPATAARIDQLRRHVERFPGGYVKTRELARLLRASGRFSEAVPLYARVLHRRADLTAIAFELADVHRALDETAAAREVLERALRFARAADAPLVEAQLARIEGRAASAATILRKALQDASPGAGALWLLLAETLYENGEIAESCAAFDNASTLRPGDARASIGSHDALLAAGTPRAALARAMRVLQREPGNPAALLRVAAARLAAGAEDARELAGRAAEAAPAAAAGHVLLAIHAARAENLEAARNVLRPFLHAHPAHGDAWLANARLLAAYGEPPRAAAAARIALVFAQHAADGDIRVGAAGVLARTSVRGEWRDCIAGVAELRTNWRRMIEAARELRDAGGAEDLLAAVTDAAVLLQPHLAPSWSARAHARARTGNTDGAREALDAALARLRPREITEDVVAAAAALADSLRTDDADAARLHDRTVLRAARLLRAVDRAASLAWSGIAAERLGHYGRAVVLLAAAIEAAPGAPLRARVDAAIRRIALRRHRHP
ncbi:MAG TPA: sigma-70 family RNA polymerase sigma factor [Thermoanaerobaculia bacterium]